MQHRALRCAHKFYRGLCVEPTCAHFEGSSGRTESAPISALVQAALLVSPRASNGVIADQCNCSTSLVSEVRGRLGLSRRKR